MSRNPYARALRVKPQLVINDKREKTYREILNEEIERGLTEEDIALLGKLR